METTLVVPTIDIRTRIPDAVIRQVVRRIAEQFHPQRIILFGSYASGTPRPESDVDLLVVMDTPLKESLQAIEILCRIKVLFGLDLLVYTPLHLAERIQWGDTFLIEILENGMVLYESTNP